MRALDSFIRWWYVAKRVTRVKIDNLSGEMSKAFDRLMVLGIEKANKIYRAAALKLMTDIIIETPVDEGTLRNNWFITTNRASTKTTRSKNKSKGFNYVNQAVPKIILSMDKRRKIKSKKVFLANNLPYAAIVEFGLYPNPVERGTYVKQKKSYEKRSAGGFSRLAPRGMFRKNILRFPSLVKQASKGF